MSGDLNAFGITHLGEIPKIILNSVKSPDNVTTRLYRLLCVDYFFLVLMID